MLKSQAGQHLPAVSGNRQSSCSSTEKYRIRNLAFTRQVSGLLIIAVVSFFLCVYGGNLGYLLAVVGSSSIICLCYPRDWWPAASCTLLLLVPFSYAPLAASLSYIVPSSLVMLAYVLGGLGRQSPWMGRGLAILIGLLAAYCSLQIPFSGSDNNARKFIWIVLLLFVIFLPSIHTSTSSMLRPLIFMTLTSGFIIAVIGVFEYWAKSSFMAGYFAAGSNALTQKWGDYRILTVVGHPLVNATFLSMVASAAFAVFMISGRKSTLPVLAVASAALIFTQSRTGILALAIGLTIVVLCTASRRSQVSIIVGLLLVSAVVVLLMQADSPLMRRNSSTEGQGSSDLRAMYLEILPELMRAATLWGTGLGLSDSALQKSGGYAAGFPIESSAIQIIVGLGVVGSTLFFVIIASIFWMTLRRGAVIAPAMLVSYAVAASGFNLFEAFPALIALPGVLLAACIAEATIDRHQASISEAATRYNIK